MSRMDDPQTSYLPPTEGPRRSDSDSPVRSRPRQSGLEPARLREAARQTQPSEPILLPKLRILFADFPYLHCSIPPEAAHLGDLLRLWVRRGARAQSNLPSLGFSRAVGSAPDATSSVALCRKFGPYLRPIRFQGNAPSRRKDNSSRGSRRRLRVRLRCRRRPRPTPHSRSRMLTRFPFGAWHLRRGPARNRREARMTRRLHRAQNGRRVPRQASGISPFP